MPRGAWPPRAAPTGPGRPPPTGAGRPRPGPAAPPRRPADGAPRHGGPPRAPLAPPGGSAAQGTEWPGGRPRGPAGPPAPSTLWPNILQRAVTQGRQLHPGAGAPQGRGTRRLPGEGRGMRGSPGEGGEVVSRFCLGRGGYEGFVSGGEGDEGFPRRPPPFNPGAPPGRLRGELCGRPRSSPLKLPIPAAGRRDPPRGGSFPPDPRTPFDLS